MNIIKLDVFFRKVINCNQNQKNRDWIEAI